MTKPSDHHGPFDIFYTWRGFALQNLIRLRSLCQLLTLPTLIILFGFRTSPIWTNATWQIIAWCLVGTLTVLPFLKWILTRGKPVLRPRYALSLLVANVTIIGSIIFFLFGYQEALNPFWHLALLIYFLIGLLSLFRKVSLLGWSPAFILVMSFLSFIAVGTLLLMLPRAQAEGQATDVHRAFFTATSAVCVTGLVVVDTGSWWSREGQIVILILIQFGGLGLMTSGAAFALMVRRGLVLKERRILTDLLERSVLDDLRLLINTIFLYTLIIELVGALLLSGLWSEQSLGDQIFYSLFHSISAFCNAGFALDVNSMIPFARSWQVLIVMPLLVILGGIGFVVVYDLGAGLLQLFTKKSRVTLFHSVRQRHRLSLTTKIVLFSTIVLLVMGTVIIYVLEISNEQELSFGNRIEIAWFHSVSSRTAGFNTYPLADLNPSTLFFMALLMGIGASPGSTGGGVKTVPIVVCLLTLRALMRGRSQVEIGHRTIPPRLVFRALTIVVLGLMMMVILTLVIVSIEYQPSGFRFLDYLFEVTSALATVGLSTGVTNSLSTASLYILALAMFSGRVGPLTLIISVAGREQSSGAYSYPEERVLLG